MEDEINIREYLEVLARRWKTILAVMVVMAVLAFYVSLKIKPAYESSTTILLQNDSSSSGASQVAGIAGMLGINLGAGGGNLGDLTELLKSKVVAAKVLDDLDLIHKVKGWDNPKTRKSDMISAVSAMIKPAKAAGNILEIKTEADDPQLAADVANGYVSALAYYWNQLMLLLSVQVYFFYIHLLLKRKQHVDRHTPLEHQISANYPQRNQPQTLLAGSTTKDLGDRQL